jgi:hypothetical protein
MMNRKARIAAKARKICTDANPTWMRKTAEKTLDNVAANVPTAPCSISPWMFRFGCESISWSRQCMLIGQARRFIVLSTTIAISP